MVSGRRIILVDTNVWLDQYLPVRPHKEESQAFMDYALTQGIELAFPASIIKDVFYIVANEYKRIVRSETGSLTESDARAIQQLAWGVVDNMQEIATPVGMDLSDVWLASKWRRVDADLEDNLVRAAAKRAKSDLLVTWDKGMLSKAVIPTLTPTDAVSEMGTWQGGQ
jgi:predicted nucleic acid-binding protein